jgi:putative membrane protein
VPGFLVRTLITALGLWIASELSEGIRFASASSLLIAALLLGVTNAIIRPILVILTLPITLVTLGLFLLVINALMIEFVAWLMPGFYLAGFGSAFWGALLVSITGWVASSFVGPRGNVELFVTTPRSDDRYLD